MDNQHTKPQPSHDPEDPRLRIPDVLRDGPTTSTKPETGPSAAVEMAKAWGTALEFIATIGVGGGLGWLFDKWQPASSPWGSLIGFGLGFVMAMFRIIRATQKQERAEAANKSRSK